MSLEQEVERLKSLTDEQLQVIIQSSNGINGMWEYMWAGFAQEELESRES